MYGHCDMSIVMKYLVVDDVIAEQNRNRISVVEYI
jgi:hypothetical protein